MILAAWATCVVKSILKDPQAPYGQWNCAKNIRPCYVLRSNHHSLAMYISYIQLRGELWGGGGESYEVMFRPLGFAE